MMNPTETLMTTLEKFCKEDSKYSNMPPGLAENDWGTYCIHCGYDDKPYSPPSDFMHKPNCLILYAQTLLLHL